MYRKEIDISPFTLNQLESDIDDLTDALIV